MAENVSRTTISLPIEVADKAEPRWKTLGYKSFSEYVSFLIASDLHEKPSHNTTRDESGVSYTKAAAYKKPHTMLDNLRGAALNETHKKYEK